MNALSKVSEVSLAGKTQYKTMMRVQTLDADSCRWLKADASLAVSSGAAWLQTYCTADELREAAHLLTVAADQIEAARRPVEVEA